MPRGVPKNGFRMTKKRRAAKLKNFDIPVPLNVIQNETDEEISDRLNERFDILQILTSAAVTGEARALIVSGPPGLGKSFTVEKKLEEWDPNGNSYSIIKGYVRATGLYKTLWQNRFPGNVVVFDDADSVFFDDTSLALLKAVCDTTEKRRVHWLSEGTLVDEESATVIDRSFEFEGTIIFITNYDFDAMIERGHKLAAHLEALMSRAHYIDLSMKTRRDYLVRIRQVVDNGLLSSMGLDKTQEEDVMKFIDQNQDKLRELSIRIAIKVAALRKTNDKWDRVARVTCCKN